MTNLDSVRKSLANMPNDELADRWKRGMFSEEAAELARSEMELRGITVLDIPQQPPYQHESNESARPRGGGWKINILLFIGCVLVTGIIFVPNNPLRVVGIVARNPTLLIDLIASGLGRFLVFFAVGGVIELIIALVSRSRPSFRRSLAMAAGLTALVFLSTLLSSGS